MIKIIEYRIHEISRLKTILKFVLILLFTLKSESTLGVLQSLDTSYYFDGNSCKILNPEVKEKNEINLINSLTEFSEQLAKNKSPKPIKQAQFYNVPCNQMIWNIMTKFQIDGTFSKETLDQEKKVIGVLHTLNIKRENEKDLDLLKKLLMEEKKLKAFLISNSLKHLNLSFEDRDRIKSTLFNLLDNFEKNIFTNCTIDSLIIKPEELYGMQYKSNQKVNKLKNIKSICDILLTNINVVLLSLDLTGVPVFSTFLTLIGSANFVLGYTLRQIEEKILKNRADFHAKLGKTFESKVNSGRPNQEEFLDFSENISDLFSEFIDVGSDIGNIFAIPGNLSFLLSSVTLDNAFNNLSKNGLKEIEPEVFLETERFYLKTLEFTHNHNSETIAQDLRNLNSCKNEDNIYSFAIDRIINLICKNLVNANEKYNKFKIKVNSEIEQKAKDLYSYINDKSHQIDSENQRKRIEFQIRKIEEERISKIKEMILFRRKESEKINQSSFSDSGFKKNVMPIINSSLLETSRLTDEQKNDLKSKQWNFIAELNDAKHSADNAKPIADLSIKRWEIVGKVFRGVDLCKRVWENPDIEFCCSYLLLENDPKRCRFKSSALEL